MGTLLSTSGLRTMQDITDEIIRKKKNIVLHQLLLEKLYIYIHKVNYLKCSKVVGKNQFLSWYTVCEHLKAERHTI